MAAEGGTDSEPWGPSLFSCPRGRPSRWGAGPEQEPQPTLRKSAAASSPVTRNLSVVAPPSPVGVGGRFLYRALVPYFCHPFSLSFRNRRRLCYFCPTGSLSRSTRFTCSPTGRTNSHPNQAHHPGRQAGSQVVVSSAIPHSPARASALISYIR